MKFIVTLLILTLTTFVSAKETWRGLVVEPEYRCTPYDKKKQYPYSQSVEDIIVENMGGRIYGPYTGSYFASDRLTDIEHIVSTSEAHDAGLCKASSSVKKAFANDPLNLTLASPKVNRCSAGGKCGFDAGEWLPRVNVCWFANRVVEIKFKYKLSVDKREATALESVLSSCQDFDMIFYQDTQVKSTPVHLPKLTPQQQNQASDALSLYDDNNNGRITCAEARNHNITPVHKGHAAYEFMWDKDNDGVVCE